MDVLPEKDLNTQMQREIVSLCRHALGSGRNKRNSIKSQEEWKTLKVEYYRVFKQAFPDILFDRSNPLKSRIISSYEFDGIRIENVIFESLPGWEVNATIYLPRKKGGYPGVVCPVGHSSKTFLNYQRSAQTIALNGYVVITFDPPGCSGEKQYMNDHFDNGVVGYLTGLWSMTFFVADAIRALDYLEIRDDVDLDAGFTMTGVSGGGLTAIFCTILDDRVKLCAPVCCLAEHESIHLTDLYTSCPEQFGRGLIAAGMDYADYLCLLEPRPCLVVAGKHDEVFGIWSTIDLFNEAKNIYNAAGIGERIGLFVDQESGHAYTIKMASEVVSWMNRFIKGTDMPALRISEKDIAVIEQKKLRCYPDEKVNMYTINRDLAERLEADRIPIIGTDDNRDQKLLINKVRACLGIGESDFGGFTSATEQKPCLRWFHQVQKISVIRDDVVQIPGILLKRTGKDTKVPALLFIDQRGKWEGFRHNGFLARTGGFLDEIHEEHEPLVFSIDVSGFGSLAPEPAAYDLAEWNDIERILTYLSVSVGRPVMGLRVRDTLAALKYLEKREDVDSARIMIGGRGNGAVAALHAALLWGKASGIICLDMLSHYGAITGTFSDKWSHSTIIPDILKYYDLPDIASCLAVKSKLSIINLSDTENIPITEDKAKALYAKAIDRGARIVCCQDIDTLRREVMMI